MNCTYKFEAIYGAVRTIYFGIPSTGDGDGWYTGAAPIAGDVKIVKDGGAAANTTNLPALIATSNGIWSLDLTAAELQAQDIHVSIDDADGPAFGAVHLQIQTSLRLGFFNVDAAARGGNNFAVVFTGVGTAAGLAVIGGVGDGHGIYAAGGTTGGSGIFGEALAGIGHGIRGIGFTSGAGISGEGGATGPGIRALSGATSGDGILAQAQTLGHGMQCLGAGSGGGGIRAEGGTDGHGIQGIGKSTGSGVFGTAGATGKIANFLDTLEGTEPAGATSNNATFAQILQYLKRRFYNKVTQTVTLQVVFKDDSTTQLTTMAVSDDGVTQTKGKSA